MFTSFLKPTHGIPELSNVIRCLKKQGKFPVVHLRYFLLRTTAAPRPARIGAGFVLRRK